MAEHNESWVDVENSTITIKPHDEIRFKKDKLEYSTITDEILNKETEGYGNYYYNIGIFTFWTKNRVYFSVEYDGMPGISSVSRHPTTIPNQIITG